MNIENMEKAVAIRKYMNDHPSKFTYVEGTEFNKTYRYEEYEAKSRAIINNDICMTSDNFIIYAIAVLRCADFGTILDYLNLTKKRNREFELLPEYTVETLRSRLQALKKHGLLFNITYVDPTSNTDGTQSDSLVSLYTATRDAINIMNSALRRQIKPDAWLEQKPLDELIGIAATSAVLVKLAERDTFKASEQTIFKGRFSGVTWLDGELITEISGQLYYNGLFSVYLHRHSELCSEQDYKKLIEKKLNTVRDYLNNRTTKGITTAILVCEDNDDMVRIAKAIMNSGAFEDEHLENIHFTSYGLMNGYGKNPDEWFLNLQRDNSEKGFTFVLNTTEFV